MLEKQASRGCSQLMQKTKVSWHLQKALHPRLPVCALAYSAIQEGVKTAYQKTPLC